MPTEVKCERCNGRGVERWEHGWYKPPPDEKTGGWGVGYVSGRAMLTRVCPDCNGHGIEKPRHLVPRIGAS
jgi:DnaJ-class molecular chaperone